VAGDIESIREWITPGVNGLLVEPSSAQGLAEAILTALDSPVLRRYASDFNIRLIREQAEVGVIKERIRQFYGAFGT